jgi:ribosome maturation factor RimP
LLPEPDQVAPFLRKIAEDSGFDVIAVKVDGRRHVRMWVDLEPDGVNVDDTTRLSRALGEALETEGLDPGSFQFEVQSPGLDRLLAREKDFVRFAGGEVKVRLHKKRSDRANYTGTLIGWRDGKVVVADGDKEWTFALDEIREARLVPDLPWAKVKDAAGSSGRHRRHNHSGRQRKQKQRGKKRKRR